MTQRKLWLLVCLLLLSTAYGCKTTMPQSTTSPPAISPASPISGWKTIKGNGVDLSLPESYEGGNPSTDLSKISQQLKALGPDYEKRIDSLKQDPSSVALLAFDPQSAKSGFMTNVNVTTESVPAGTTVEQYINAAVKQLGSQYQVLEQKVVSINKYKAGRILAEPKTGETSLKQLFYFIQNGDTFWLVTYSTTKNEFELRLPDFEKSINTFTLSS